MFPGEGGYRKLTVEDGDEKQWKETIIVAMECQDQICEQRGIDIRALSYLLAQLSEADPVVRSIGDLGQHTKGRRWKGSKGRVTRNKIGIGSCRNETEREAIYKEGMNDDGE